MKQNLLSRQFYTLIATSTALFMSACGPDAYVPTTIISDQTAAGDMSLPPKVDIVLGVSNGGTMQNIYPTLSPEIQNFALSLQNKGWDYRFVTISLSEYSPGTSAQITSRVAASVYDTNTPFASWKQPFPNASYTDPSLKLNPSLYASYPIIPSLDYTYNNGRESGLKNQADFLNRADVKYNPSNPYANVLRPDALLAVMTISNGRDTSDGWYSAWNGMNPYPTNVANYVNQMKAVRSDVKYYALVAHNTTNCRAGTAWSGTLYEQAAQLTGGISQDICQVPVSTALDAVAQHLQAQKLNFVKNYLVIGTEPNVATIKVFKNGVEVPQSTTNGWSYAGYLTNQFTIESPVPMAQASGYMVQLHGTAKLTGSDKARVEYMNAGAQSSH